MFDTALTAEPGLVDGCEPGAEVEAWSEYAPSGLLADRLDFSRARRSHTHPNDHGVQLLERIGGWERVIAWAQANQLAEMAGFVAHVESQPRYGMWLSRASESAVAEIGLMLGVSPRTAAARVDVALDLVNRLPAVHAGLAAGRLSLPAARAIAEETATLNGPETSAVVEAVLPRSAGRTPGQLRAATRKAVAEVDPDAVRHRHQKAVAERGVWLHDEPDGMASLHARLRADDAVAAYTVLDRFARHSDGPADNRSIEARRADALVDLLSGAVLGKVRVELQVTVPFTTLAGLDERAGELAGYGPVPADMVRRLAGDATWRRLLTDPASGAVLDYGLTRYRPPAHLASYVRTRYPRCTFPGCRTPARRADLDHDEPHNPGAGTGPTSEANLDPKCRRHHRLKQMPGWSVHHAADGTITWRTPNGRHYHVRPEM